MTNQREIVSEYKIVYPAQVPIVSSIYTNFSVGNLLAGYYDYFLQINSSS